MVDQVQIVEAQNGKKADKPKANGSARQRGRPGDSAEMRCSKSLSWILRHGAEQEGLVLRPDGYVPLGEVLARPIMKGVDEFQIRAIVEKDQKSRFGLWEESDRLEKGAGGQGQGVWIKANQGHSLKTVNDLSLVDITDPASLPLVIHGTYQKHLKQIVQSGGLKRMSRNHIHLSTGLPKGCKNEAGEDQKEVKSGIRSNCDCFIYIDLPLAMSDGIHFLLSENGVVLTEGLKGQGLLPIKYFEKVTDQQGEQIELSTVGLAKVILDTSAA